ncbi:MAG TPA: histidine--tRNA ligase [Caulobacteraceae bacterium]|jgi:histidyl-tRNA synthetase|nr:histidine--tRNA ligase [Caulobacteraceae bacterium]
MTQDAPSRPLARAPRGFQDRRAGAVLAERRILDAVSRVYESFGFEALDTGALEFADALGKFLPDADRPNEGVFALRDEDDGEWMALRYDLTAPLARFAAEHWESLPKPYRRYAYGPVWRNEKPGPGHGRQFIQCDADTVGSARPEADAEIIAMALEGYGAAGLPAGACVMKINNRKLLDGLLTVAGVSDAGQKLSVLRAVDKLDRLGPDGTRALLGRGRRDESGAFTRGSELETAGIDAVMAFVEAGRATRSQTLERLSQVIGGSSVGDEGLGELERIGASLSSLGVAEEQALFDPSVVRGLEYYTGAVFEAQLTGEGLDRASEALRYGSIGGGGRYDDLVARFTGERTPATGFSFGVSRLAGVLAATSGAAPTSVRGPVVVLALDAGLSGEYFALAAELRAAGLAAEVYLGASGMRAQMKYADRRLSPAAVIVGSDEIAQGLVTIKDLDLGRQLAGAVSDNRAWREDRPGQISVPRAQMVAQVRRIVEAAS